MADPEVNFEIQLATAEDAPYLLRAIQSYFAYDGILFDSVRVPVSLQLLLTREDIGRAWIVRVDQKPIGYAIVGFGFDLEFGGRQATLTDLFIEPSFRGKGIGAATLQHIEKACLAWRVNAIELQAETDNSEALSLYEKQGFKRHTRIPMSKRLV
jgi:diamine N-acetyltransferase